MWGYPCRYAPACTKLLAQYKTIMKLVGDSVPSLEAFMQEYRVRLPMFSTFPVLTLPSYRWTVPPLLIGYESVYLPLSSTLLKRTAGTGRIWLSRSRRRRRCVEVSHSSAPVST
jgi:hypothetical protein